MAKTKARSSGSAAQAMAPAVHTLAGQFQRPRPPAGLIGVEGALSGPRFVPAPELRDWMRLVFIEPDSPMANPDHAHLQHANLGVLWTNAPNSRHGRAIVGQAESMPPMGAMGKWQKARVLQQIGDWFGEVPDFLLTFYAPYAEKCGDAEFCALVEHELYHCGQDCDEHGPKFDKLTGLPKFAMRAHDVEEFVGVVRRYGAEASNAGALIEAAKHRPEIAPAQIAGACGTCAARAA